MADLVRDAEFSEYRSDLFDVGVVIPAYKQPGFLTEALESVLSQRGIGRVGAVIVDDGCPLPQTRAVGLSYARRYPDQFVYLRRANGGLSAARNTGVDFILKAWPGCRSIYPLDSDNRIMPDFLARSLKALDEAPANIGWVYPDIDFFGFDDNYSNGGEYSYFLHLLENYCEAGSLIRREVFEGGLRYQESMRWGFEDWDFWVRAAQAGWRGRFLPMAGFRYRKRAESMLAGSERVRPFILGDMRIRYAKHLTPQALMRAEAEEVPRFALFMRDEAQVRYLVDPVLPAARLEDRSVAQKRFVAANRNPRETHFPAHVCFASQPALDMLARAGLLRNLFYQATIALRDTHFLAVTLRTSTTGEMGLKVVPRQVTVGAEAVIFFARTPLLEEVAKDPYRDWVNSIAGASPQPHLAQVDICLPEDLVPAGLPLIAGDMLAEIDGLRDVMLSRSTLPATWRADARRPRFATEEAYRELLKCGTTLPYIPPPDRRDIGFILPLFAFGGVEKVVFNYARAMRKLGWRPHLFITGAMHIQRHEGHHEVFETVNFFQGEIESADWNRLHLGACVSGFGAWGDTRDAVGLLASMNVVLTTHALGGHGIMASLRSFGVKTYVGLHLVERGALGHPSGNPHIALAYEGAYDGFVVISDKLRDWCVGQAVPAEKIIKVLNAPSYEADPDRLASALAARESSAGRPLRVLYLGRLDPQKGLERLYEMILATRSTRFEWRVVGKSVLEGSALDFASIGVTLEPPAMTEAELDALYAWADVVVLPSRFEGVPLTILEAQRFGCVVVATAVGAVAEIVQDRVDGFLVPGEASDPQTVSAFVTILGQLAEDRARLRRVGLAAVARLRDSTWAGNITPWIRQIERALGPAA